MDRARTGKLAIKHRDAKDGSYDIPAHPDGEYLVTRSPPGTLCINNRFAADARLYTSTEEAPGTSPTRIPVALFAHLARPDITSDDVAAPVRPLTSAARQLADGVTSAVSVTHAGADSSASTHGPARWFISFGPSAGDAILFYAAVMRSR